MAFPVKYIHNNMRGAPQISGSPGTFIAVLDAFLITGFGQVAALSVTVNNGIATATLNAGDTFAEYAVVLVAGATPEALNGEARVLTATNASITWATTAPNGPATGTITIKMAPVGWEKVFSATNKAAYRSTDAAGSRFYLYVDDTGTQFARVRGFEAMSDISTGTGPFPTDAQMSGGGALNKSSQANATPVRYDLIADSRAVLWAIGVGAGENADYKTSPLRGFGDMLPLAPGGDGYAVALACRVDMSSYAWQYHYGYDAFGAKDLGVVTLARAASGMGSAIQVPSRPYVGTVGSGEHSGRDNALGDFPSSIDGELKHTRCFIQSDASSKTPRAEVPGLLYIPQNKVSAQISPRDTVIGGAGMLYGRKLLALHTSQSSYAEQAPSSGVYLVDITGPWR